MRQLESREDLNNSYSLAIYSTLESTLSYRSFINLRRSWRNRYTEIEKLNRSKKLKRYQGREIFPSLFFRKKKKKKMSSNSDYNITRGEKEKKVDRSRENRVVKDQDTQNSNIRVDRFLDLAQSNADWPTWNDWQPAARRRGRKRLRWTSLENVGGCSKRRWI